jgi:integrase
MQPDGIGNDHTRIDPTWLAVYLGISMSLPDAASFGLDSEALTRSQCCDCHPVPRRRCGRLGGCNLLHQYFKPILERAGLSRTIRLYDLRHTHATMLLQAGENTKVVSERLGHASITLTLDVYTHVLPDMQQRATERLEKLMFG